MLNQIASPKNITLDSIMQCNRNAWDRSCEEYTSFCKAYYINLVLTNRYQQLVEQRQELINRVKNKDKAPANPFYQDLAIFKAPGGGKPGRGAGRGGGANRALQQAMFGGPTIKSLGKHNMDKVDYIRHRIHNNGVPKMAADVGASMPGGLPAMYDQPNDGSGNADDKRKRHRRTATEI